MQFKLKITDVKHAPRKAQLVACLIRQRRVDDAIIILENTPKRSAQTFIKLLKNAQASARHNYKLDANSLVIDEVFATASKLNLRQRRMRRQPKKNTRQRVLVAKKTSHIFVTISGQPRKETKPTKEANNGTES